MSMKINKLEIENVKRIKLSVKIMCYTVVWNLDRVAGWYEDQSNDCGSIGRFFYCRITQARNQSIKSKQ